MPVAKIETPHGAQRLVALSASLLVVLTALLVLCGWTMGLTSLTSVVPGWPTMKVNTAVCFLTGGVALLLSAWTVHGSRARNYHHGVRLLVGLLIAVPVLTMSQDLLGWGDSIDRMLSPLMHLTDPAGFDRMSPATALGFVLVGLSMLLIEGGARSIWAAQSLASSVFLLAMLSLLAYLFDADRDVARPFSSMAVHTACAFVLLSVALVSVRSHQGWVGEFFKDTPSARIGRRLLVSTVLSLPLIAQLSLYGERNLVWYGPAFGIVILTVAGIAVLASLNWTAVRLGNDADRKLGNLRRVNATLSGINTLIVRVRDKETLFREACQIAGEVGAFPLVWIATIDAAHTRADLQGWFDAKGALLSGLDRRLELAPLAGSEAGILNRVLRTRSPVIVNDLFSELVADNSERSRVSELLAAGIRSLVALPLMQERLKGAGVVQPTVHPQAARTGTGSAPTA